jgi:hypothetical protein
MHSRRLYKKILVPCVMAINHDTFQLFILLCNSFIFEFVSYQVYGEIVFLFFLCFDSNTCL